METRISEITNGLLDLVATKGEMDAISDLELLGFCGLLLVVVCRPV